MNILFMATFPRVLCHLAGDSPVGARNSLARALASLARLDARAKGGVAKLSRTSPSPCEYPFWSLFLATTPATVNEDIQSID